ncbi:sensor histidine kinase [Chitinimonas naiadis]
MPTLFQPSILRRVFLFQAVLFLLIWLMLLAGVTFMAFQRDEDFEQGTVVLASALAEFSSVGPLDAQQISEVARRLQRINETMSDGNIQGDEFAYQVWSADGRLLARSGNAGGNLPPGTSPPDERLQRGDWQWVARWSSDKRLYATVGIRDSFFWRLVWQDIWFHNVIAALLIMLFLLVTAWLGLRSSLRPLRRFAAQVARRSPQDLSPVTVEGDYAELRPMADSFNDWLARLRQRMETDRAFYSDAAHELRTPLAVLAAQLHLLAESDSAADRRQARIRLEQGIQRAGGLVSQLLEIARLESRQDGLEQTPLDLAQFARERLALQADRALEKSQQLSLEAPDHLPWQGDREALASLLDSLLDNAIRYTPPGGQITVSLVKQADAMQIAVCDDGPGIPPVYRTQIFDRFYRLPDSPAGGTGLGLAIVRRVAELHGGTISLTEGLGGRGAGFYIRLPCPVTLAA